MSVSMGIVPLAVLHPALSMGLVAVLMGLVAVFAAVFATPALLAMIGVDWKD